MLSTGHGSESEIKRGREEGREGGKEGRRKKIWSDVLIDSKEWLSPERKLIPTMEFREGEGKVGVTDFSLKQTNKQTRWFDNL